MREVPLTAACLARVNALFHEEDATLVADALTRECGANLEPAWSAVQLDRLRFAVLKLSQGQLARFDAALKLAKTDWRDLLMNAGFAHDTDAHLSWQP